jgi:hypothetical protein
MLMVAALDASVRRSFRLEVEPLHCGREEAERKWRRNSVHSLFLRIFYIQLFGKTLKVRIRWILEKASMEKIQYIRVYFIMTLENWW